MNDRPAVEIVGLEKSYRRRPVLTGVDLAARRGGVLALLGPNGAGKTTMVRILGTLLRPDAGEARVAGLDVVRDRRQVRRRISLTGQYAAVDDMLTGKENLRLMARLAGLSRPAARRRTAELLERFDLTGAAGRRVAEYSGGMRRRLDLAASLVDLPSVLFLDEPTTGLDLPSRREMWAAVEELSASGVTTFLTTQYLEEADRLADRVAVLDRGRIVAHDTPAELKRQVGGRRLELVLTDRKAFAQVGARLGDRAVGRDPEQLTLSAATDGSALEVRTLLDELDPERTAVRRFAVRSATLDDVFLALTGHTTGGHTSAVDPTTGSDDHLVTSTRETTDA